MSYYFTGSLKQKIRDLVPEISETPEIRQPAASIVKNILDMISPEDVKIVDGKILIGPTTTIGASEYYDHKALACVEQDLRREFKDEFGANAEVSFTYGGSTKEPVPEGGTKLIHLYKLSMVVRL